MLSYFYPSQHWMLGRLVTHFTDKDQCRGLHIYASHSPLLPLPPASLQSTTSPITVTVSSPRISSWKPWVPSWLLLLPYVLETLQLHSLATSTLFFPHLLPLPRPTFPKLCSPKHWSLERGLHGQLTSGKTACYMLFSNSHNEHINMVKALRSPAVRSASFYVNWTFRRHILYKILFSHLKSVYTTGHRLGTTAWVSQNGHPSGIPNWALCPVNYSKNL